MKEAVLALNAGSSSVKFGLFERRADDEPALVCKGVLEDRGSQPRFTAQGSDGAGLADRTWPEGTHHDVLIDDLLSWIEAHLGDDTLVGVGHRVVHGGLAFHRPLRLDDSSIAAIDRLTPLAPLHQPRSLEPIHALASLRPDLAQVACFDTAFHHDIAPPASRYGLPRALEAEGIRKYGFHGLSYDYVASRLPDIDIDLPRKRTIVAHLGQGASLCAMQNGRSLDTTMGFSALDGLVMGTRCGSLDPGIVLYLLQVRGMSVEAVETLLYRESGLLGVSGLSADMRELEASPDPHARQAIDLFTFRIAKEIAALCVSLGGLDLLVFTGGIGEHSTRIRAEVCDRLTWLGVSVAADDNAKARHRIDLRDTPVEVRIIPTDEECVIARHTDQVLRGGSKPD